MIKQVEVCELNSIDQKPFTTILLAKKFAGGVINFVPGFYSKDLGFCSLNITGIERENDIVGWVSIPKYTE